MYKHEHGYAEVGLALGDRMTWPVYFVEDAGLSQDPSDEGVKWSLVRKTDGTVLRLRDADPGAMWINAHCQNKTCKGAERGGCLVVKIPGGNNWQIDHPESGGNASYWTREGEPPNVTVSPSINIPGYYHGWLRAGQLVDA